MTGKNTVTQKQNLQKFFFEMFDRNFAADPIFIEKELISFGDMDHFMYIPEVILYEEIIYIAEQRAFSKSIPGNFSNMDAGRTKYTLSSDIMSQEERPEGNYWIAYKDSVRPSREYWNKTYEGCFEEGGMYMNIKEYMLCRLYTYYLKREFWDEGKISATITSSMWKGIIPVYGFSRDGRFAVSHYARYERFKKGGPRPISVF